MYMYFYIYTGVVLCSNQYILHILRLKKCTVEVNLFEVPKSLSSRMLFMFFIFLVSASCHIFSF